ncbi:ArsR/SmtB family transcription factor [Cytobacillus massiliigabonensis]|uniref:ArsR/SmtB family transcription factor n=1 Tax=Cytobacillus massiliigabonensis TaxID=1871011 RepID=UPI000C81F410|nr:metalloregulator ArsR/SmtB family transcription factor [Cytobacillus massiliigabonensis]
MSQAAHKHDVFQAIADPTRREVLRLLSQKEMPISKITEHFPMTRTAITKHLHVLAEAKLVSGRKEGREKVYQLHPEPLEEVQQWISFYEKFWNNKLSILKYIVENEDKN